ncbi:MAG: ABC transporter ATP-binding protein [Caldilineaceae bacterium]|nr:ABC transporter ATP-binding protein [Caldilineaceae bacterium]
MNSTHVRAHRQADGVPTLTLDGLTIQLKTRRGTANVVDRVDLEVWPGEIVGLIGESGSGKSLTAFSIFDLLPKAARVVGGDIRLGARSLVGLSAPGMRAIRGDRIALIPQDPLSSLNPVLRVGRQVGEPLVLHRGSRWRQALARAVSLLASVHLPQPAERAGEYPHQFSGGMRQRAMSAMSIALEPELLVADEPTTALDVTIQAQFLHLLREIRDEHRTSILLITHDLGVVAELCDWVYVMYAGRILEQGPVERIFAQPAHPYTQDLLQATPTVETQRSELTAIPGSVPSPYDTPEGCRFAPRCSRRFDRCDEEPPFFAAAAEHLTRCWLEEDAHG